MKETIKSLRVKLALGINPEPQPNTDGSSTASVNYSGNDSERLTIANITVDSGQLILDYTNEYLQSGIDLAPLRLPARHGVITHSLASPFGPLPGLLDDAMPDAWGHRIMDRTFAAIGISHPTVLQRLAWLGTSTMGALSFHPESQTNQSPDAFDLGETYRETQEIIVGTPGELLPAIAKAGGSPGGARPKVLAGINAKGELITGEAALPAGFEPWIIKFRAPVDGEAAGQIEHAYLKMAKNAGISVCDSQLLTDSQGMKHLAVKRFDRSNEAGRLSRIHMSTVSGLLHADHRLPSINCETLLRLTRSLTGDTRAVIEIFRRCVFNVIAHNRDEHTKNTSFLFHIAPEGIKFGSAEPALATRRDGLSVGQWGLSPAYDLTFAHGPGGEHTMTINGKGKGITREDAIQLAKSARIDISTAEEVISQVEQAVKRWKQHALASEVPSSDTAFVAKRHGWGH